MADISSAARNLTSTPWGAMPLLDETMVRDRLAGRDLQAALKQAFQQLAADDARQPPQTLTLLPNGGDFIAYLGALSRPSVFGVKLSPYLPSLGDKGLPPVTAFTLLLSAETGRPLLLCDSLALTTQRTAATTALAVDLLSSREVSRLSLIGSGPVAQAHLEQVLPLRDWQEVSLYSPSLATNPDKLAKLQAIAPQAKLAESADAAADGAEVVLLSTSSGTAVIDTDKLAKDVLVTSISTNVARAHEIEPDSLFDFQVFCDYRPTCPLSAGEMVLASENFGWKPQEMILGDLPELITGKALSRHQGKRFFRSIGLGLEDLAAAALLL
ncbi:ornithine cyclodeaminase family protein [Rhodovibrionaceae bacterium A322]